MVKTHCELWCIGLEAVMVNYLYYRLKLLATNQLERIKLLFIIVVTTSFTFLAYSALTTPVPHECPFKKTDACPTFSNIEARRVTVMWMLPTANAHLVRRYELYVSGTYGDGKQSLVH